MCSVFCTCTNQTCFSLELLMLRLPMISFAYWRNPVFNDPLSCICIWIDIEQLQGCSQGNTLSKAFNQFARSPVSNIKCCSVTVRLNLYSTTYFLLQLLYH